MTKERMNRWVFLIVFSVLLVCITSAAAETFVGGDSNSNGQYQITLIVNPDGSQTLSYAGVINGAEGGSITAPESSNSVESYGADGIDPVQVQELEMSGSYGYALLTGWDAEGNRAAVETGFTNSDHVYVYQEIGPAVSDPDPKPKAVATTIEISGIEAYQEVCSRSFDTIYANANATNIDGSYAIVSASAQGSQNSEPALFGYGYGHSMFRVEQSSGTGGSIDGSESYELPSFSGSTTWATQEGKIKNVDSASVSAFASTVDGYSSGISGWITDGTIEFGGHCWYPMSASAGKSLNPFVDIYKTEVSGTIDTKSQQGGVSSFVTNPNGDSASVSSQWTWNRGYNPSEISSELKAFTQKTPTKSVIVSELELDLPRKGYSGSVSAENSIDGLNSRNFGKYSDYEASAGIVYHDSALVASWNGIHH